MAAFFVLLSFDTTAPRLIPIIYAHIDLCLWNTINLSYYSYIYGIFKYYYVQPADPYNR